MSETGVIAGIIFQVEFFMMKQNYSWAMDVVNQIIASYPTFLPALTLKMGVFLARQDWEQTREMCDRCTKPIVRFGFEFFLNAFTVCQ